jgi:hypothetical protein
MYLAAVRGRVVNDVAYANDAPIGAGIAIANGSTLTVRNTVFLENATGAALELLSGYAPTVTYNDFSMNTLDFAGMYSVVGFYGNLAVVPGFVGELNGDFHLTATSGVLDKGDPALSDLDGSRSDMGVYGGPYGY